MEGSGPEGSGSGAEDNTCPEVDILKNKSRLRCRRKKMKKKAGLSNERNVLLLPEDRVLDEEKEGYPRAFES